MNVAETPVARPIPWWPLYAAVCLVHLVTLSLDASPWDSITKCLAVPVLIAWSLQVAHAPRLLSLALLFCLGGDAFLEFDGLFVAGMASFALAHACFIALFVSRGALDDLRRHPAVVAVLALAAIGLVALVWGGIDDPVIRAVVPFYAFLLSGTAATALVTNRLAGIGAVMFLVSDSIIALSEFGRIEPSALTSLAIMVLYLGAVAALAVGTVQMSSRDDLQPATRR